MAVLAFVCAWGTFIELDFGTPAASLLVYHHPVFHFLIFLLGVNILSAALSRLPWKKKHFPFLLAHLGVLILLTGCWITSRFAEEGKCVITEGESASSMLLNNRREIAVERTVAGDDEPSRFSIPFFGGPFNLSDRSSEGWQRDIYRPALETRSGGNGLIPALSRTCFRAHYALSSLLLRSCARPDASRIPPGLAGIERLEIIDYLVHGEFKTSDPFRVVLSGPENGSGQSKTEEVVWDFSNLEKTDRKTVVSQRGIRRWLSDGTRIVYTLADTCREAESAVRLADINADPLLSAGDPLFFLAFETGGTVTRIPYDVLRRYIPDYSDPEKTSSLSPEADFDLGCGWHVAKIEIVPTMVPGIETIQGWTARIQLKNQTSGAADSLQLSSDWHERDLRGSRSGVTGALFGILPERQERKILGRRWDKRLSKPLLELIQSPDGKLYYRYWDGTNVTAGQTVQNPDGTIEPTNLAEGRSFSVNGFLPQDELGGHLVSAPFHKETANEFYAKVRVRALLKSVSGRESSETFWLRVTPTGMTGIDNDLFARTVFDADGTAYRFQLRDRSADLGFSVRVQNFKPVYEPGSSIPSSFASIVDYIPESKGGGAKERTGVLIKMNHPGVFYSPLKHISYWAYQDSFRGPFFPGNPVFDQAVRGNLLPGEAIPREQIYQTVLSMNADPGRGLKYAGCFCVVLGIALLFFLKKKKTATPAALMLAALSVFAASGTFAGEGANSGRLDWTAWRLLPVFDEGRVMPLNSYAAITVKEICGSETPQILVSPELLADLESGTAVSILPLESFLETFHVSEAQRGELEKAYHEIQERKSAAQKNAARRIKELFPRGKRKFSAYELLFAWIAEPEVWEYIPFISDPDRRVFELIDAGHEKGRTGKYLSPAQLRGTRLFADRIDSIMEGAVKEYPDWKTAVEEGKTDRACAMAESRLSRFDALVFRPTREKQAAAEDELHKLLFPEQSTGPSSDRLTLLEELNLAVSDLKRAASLMKENLGSPFEENDFYSAQTVELGSGSEKVPVLVLIRDLYQISEGWQTNAYQRNEFRLRGLSQKLNDDARRAAEWRDGLFRTGQGTPEYREAVLKAVRLLGLTADRIENTIPKIWTGHWKSAVSVPDKERITLNANRCWASPAARFSSRGAGTLSLVPNPSLKSDLENGQGGFVWLPIQSILWETPPDLLKEGTLPSEGSESFSLADMLGEKTAHEPETADSAARAFLASVNAYRTESENRAELFNNALWRFSQELHRIAQTDTSLHAAVPYPREGELNAEYLYFRLDPFWGLWFFSLLAFTALTVSLLLGKRTASVYFFALGVLFLLLAGGITAVGGGLRAYITGWAPVTNMFETVVLLAFLVLAVTLGYAFQPLFGRRAVWCWNHSRKGNRYQTLRRAARFLLTVFFCWATVWVCYHEPGKQTGVWKAFAESFAAQGMLDRAAVIGTMGAAVWFFPRLVISIFLLPFAPRIPSQERKGIVLKVLDRRMFVALGALIAFLIGLLAYYNTSEFNPNIRPLTAVLRSNFWLTVHVLAIMFSYALGALAWILSLAVLGGACFGAVGENHIQPHLCERYQPVIRALLRFAVLFLTLGIILGARWADFSWGRFWSWDPKEVWALVTLLIYLVILHRKQKGLTLPLGGILGGLSILMTWYGLSFVFGGGGRHSYAAGQSSRTAVLWTLIAVNLIYGAGAWIVWKIRMHQNSRG